MLRLLSSGDRICDRVGTRQRLQCTYPLYFELHRQSRSKLSSYEQSQAAPTSLIDAVGVRPNDNLTLKACIPRAQGRGSSETGGCHRSEYRRNALDKTSVIQQYRSGRAMSRQDHNACKPTVSVVLEMSYCMNSSLSKWTIFRGSTKGRPGAERPFCG